MIFIKNETLTKTPKPILLIIILALLAIIISLIVLLISNTESNNDKTFVLTKEIEKGITRGDVLISGSVTTADTKCTNMKISPSGNPSGDSSFTVNSDGSFLATVVPNNSVLIVAKNTKNQACLEAIVFPNDNNVNVKIDAQSTALASAVPVNSKFTKSDYDKMDKLLTYQPLYDYLSLNLKEKNLSEIDQDSKYIELYTAYNKEVNDTYK